MTTLLRFCAGFDNFSLYSSINKFMKLGFIHFANDIITACWLIRWSFAEVGVIRGSFSTKLKPLSYFDPLMRYPARGPPDLPVCLKWI